MKNKNNKEVYLSSRGRRQFLRKGAGSMAGAWLSAWPWHELMAQQDLNPIEENWDAGVVRHLLPAVNHSTFLIKASFNRPLESAPTLRIREGSNRRETVGILNDTAANFGSSTLPICVPIRSMNSRSGTAQAIHCVNPGRFLPSFTTAKS